MGVSQVCEDAVHHSPSLKSHSGGLNLSRAIGDHAYKKTVALPSEEQAITALPDIRTLKLEAQDEFMVIACDGIWNFMSSQDVVDFVHYRLEKKTPAQICEEVRTITSRRRTRTRSDLCFSSNSCLCIVSHPIRAAMEPVATT